MSSAIFSTLYDWNATDGSVAACFDTPSSNTGQYNGACFLLEQKLQKRLLKLACRHHVLEVQLKTAFDSKFGATSAPVVPLFERFQKTWPSIDQKS